MIQIKEKAENLLLLSRQMIYLLESGHTVSDALKKVRSNIDNDFEHTAEFLENAITKGHISQPINSGRINPLTMLYRFIPIVYKENGNVVKLIVDYAAKEREFSSKVDEAWQGIRNVFIYTAAILGVAGIMLNTIAIFVIPHFIAFYQQAGARLPELSQWLFDSFGVFPLLFLTVVALFIALAMLLNFFFVRRIRYLMPLPVQLRFFPLVGSMTQQYHRYLLLYYSSLLTHCGLTGESALARCNLELGLGHSNHLTGKINAHFSLGKNELFHIAIQLAEKLGTAPQEIEFQLQQLQHKLITGIIGLREKIAIVAQISVGIIVGVLIIALYLPIFKLGNS